MLSNIPFLKLARRMILLLGLCLWPQAGVEAGEIGRVQSQQLAVLYEKNLQAAAQELINLYPGVKSELEETIGWKIDFQPTVLLIRGHETFCRLTGSDLIVAFANPKENVIVIDYSRMTTHPFTVESTLKHEICHLLLHRYLRDGNLPKWLDEGIAQWVSGGVADIIIMDTRPALLNTAVLSGKLIPIRALNEQFPADGRALMLAYEESRSLVEYVDRKYGRPGILKILAQLKAGDDIDRAVQRSFSLSLYELELRWQDRIKKAWPWLTYLSNNLYEILFFLAALLTIYGFFRILRRKREYETQENDLEE